MEEIAVCGKEGRAGDEPRRSRFERMADWFEARVATRGGYVLLYSLLFALVTCVILVTCLLAGKSFIWQVDGLLQQYVWFVYTGEWLRDFVASGFEPLMWEMNAGFGIDAIQSIAGIFLNPLFLISAFVPQSLAEYAFEAAMLATLYAAGLVFSVWTLREGRLDRASVLAAALTYVFAGNTLVMFNQPSFLIMLVAFPLVLWGTDLVFERRSPVLLVAMLTWCFACSFYDAYMVAILLVLYCLYKFWFGVRPACARGAVARAFGRWVAVFVGYTLIALFISGFLMLPQVMAVATMERLALERESSLFYAIEWYVSFAASYFGAYAPMGADAYTGFNALVPIVLVVLVMTRKKHPALFTGFVVLTAMLLLPFFGSLMNGFQYPANRWSWGYALFIAAVVARVLPDVFELTVHQRRVVAACLVACAVLFILLPLTGVPRTFEAQFALTVALAALLFSGRGDVRRRGRAVAGACVCVAVSVSIGLAGHLSPFGDAHARSLVGFGKVDAFHTQFNATALVAQAKGQGLYDEMYRYDRTAYDGSLALNSNLVAGNLGVDSYNSIYSGEVDDFVTSLGLTTTQGIAHAHGSLAARTELETLMGVRYFAVSDAEATLLPYSYRSGTVLADGILREGKHYTLYQTDQSLPLAFAYTGHVDRAAYDDLSMLERQSALMQAVVLEEGAETDGAAVPSVEAGLVFDVEAVPCEVAGLAGCEVLEDGSVFARKEGATMRLAFDGPADAETYLCFEGLSYCDVGLVERYTPAEWEAIGFISRGMTHWYDLLYKHRASSSLSVRAQGASTDVYIIGPADHLYGGKEDWAVNLGYSAEGLTELVVTFNNPGVYSFESMSVQAQPMAGFDAQYEALAANAARDVELGRNRISCSIDVDEPAELFFSVAYSKGWSAMVDGREVPVHQANLGFMGVALDPGEHEVVLTYRTPYLGAGCIMTCVGLVAFAALLVVRRVRAKAAVAALDE